jgi:hypothetical protein
MSALKAFLARWQELVFWLPLAILLAVAALAGVRYIDPRAGADAGELFAIASLVVRAVLVMAFAWLCKHLYLLDYDDATDTKLHITAGHEGPHAGAARWSLIKDRVEWAFLLLFWGWLLF